MRSTRILTLVGAIALVIGAVAGVANAGGTNHGGTMPMATMMDHMRQVMGETSQMMNHAQSQGMMGHGSMHGQSGMMSHGQAMTPGSQEMAGMVKGTDSMAQTMNGLMQHMQSMMGDQELMKDPAVAEHLQQMQRNMTTMMQGFDGFVDGVKAIQDQPSSN